MNFSGQLHKAEIKVGQDSNLAGLPTVICLATEITPPIDIIINSITLIRFKPVMNNSSKPKMIKLPQKNIMINRAKGFRQVKTYRYKILRLID